MQPLAALRSEDRDRSADDGLDRSRRSLVRPAGQVVKPALPCPVHRGERDVGDDPIVLRGQEQPAVSVAAAAAFTDHEHEPSGEPSLGPQPHPIDLLEPLLYAGEPRGRQGNLRHLDTLPQSAGDLVPDLDEPPAAETEPAQIDAVGRAELIDGEPLRGVFGRLSPGELYRGHLPLLGSGPRAEVVEEVAAAPGRGERAAQLDQVTAAGDPVRDHAGNVIAGEVAGVRVHREEGAGMVGPSGQLLNWTVGRGHRAAPALRLYCGRPSATSLTNSAANLAYTGCRLGSNDRAYAFGKLPKMERSAHR